MTDFIQPLDIGNRACQHCGVRQMLSFTEDSVAATEINFVYDKLRKAELARNVWKFATKHAVLRPISTKTRMLAPNEWDSTWPYRPGSIVSYAGVIYVATLQLGNLNQQPGLGTGGYWDVYFGPLSVEPYDSTQGYYPGELVYVNNGEGWIDVYACTIQAAGTAPYQPNPFGPDLYDATVTYNVGDVVQYTDDLFYMSLIDLNLANEPDLSPFPWNSSTTYAKTDMVVGSDGLIYTSIADSNTGHNPTTNAGSWASAGYWSTDAVPAAWTTAFKSDTTSNAWRKVLCTLKPVVFTWPIGVGPTEQSFTKNAFRLPNGYLRRAPQDPTDGGVYFLGAPTGLQINDWVIEEPYLISREVFPIPLRFVADVQQVPTFDPMFCEGLGARIGYEVCERLTQAAGKKAAILQTYLRFMTEARVVNGIETGPIESPVDALISVRI